MRFTLEAGEELDAAVSCCLGRAPQILPFSTDARARTTMQQWLAERGVTGDLGHKSNVDLCAAVVGQWLRARGSWQLYRDGGEFRAVFADRVTAVADDYVAAISRLALLIADVGFGDAVRALMAEEEAHADVLDRRDHDPFAF
ncbi:MAG: hypothetical protein KDE27_06475 [Planctomycetes bacterium]|nr:hypothetical protein [Planctomycetota bacterium]